MAWDSKGLDSFLRDLNGPGLECRDSIGAGLRCVSSPILQIHNGFIGKVRQDKRHLRNNTPNVRKRGMLTTETVLMNLFTNIWLEEYNKKRSNNKT